MNHFWSSFTSVLFLLNSWSWMYILLEPRRFSPLWNFTFVKFVSFPSLPPCSKTMCLNQNWGGDCTKGGKYASQTLEANKWKFFNNACHSSSLCVYLLIDGVLRSIFPHIMNFKRNRLSMVAWSGDASKLYLSGIE